MRAEGFGTREIAMSVVVVAQVVDLRHCLIEDMNQHGSSPQDGVERPKVLLKDLQIPGAACV